MHDLQIFKYNGKEVRTIQKDGEPLVGAERCM